jgi:hypothetical protein
MAYPFGGHPKLKDILDWLSANGCTVSQLVKQSKSGKPINVIVVENNGVGFATIPNPKLDQRLEPSMVAYYQRRLAIKTPYAATPEQTKSETSDTA